MPRDLGLLLRELRGSEDLPGEFVGRPDVDDVLVPDLLDHLVAVRADSRHGLGRHVVGGRSGDLLARQGPAVELPLLASAVEQPDVAVAVELEVPVRVGREPVVVPAVQDHLVAVGDSPLGQEFLERSPVDDVAAYRILKIALPVDADGTVDVVRLVLRGVLVHLDEDDVGVVCVFDDPFRVDQKIASTHGSSFTSSATGRAHIINARSIRLRYSFVHTVSEEYR